MQGRQGLLESEVAASLCDLSIVFLSRLQEQRQPTSCCNCWTVFCIEDVLQAFVRFKQAAESESSSECC